MRTRFIASPNQLNIQNGIGCNAIANCHCADSTKWRYHYDNSNPRGFAAAQEGWRARAVAAHNNSFEALPLFVFAVLAAQMAGLDQARTDQLAMAFIGARMVYTALYLANIAALRTVVWSVGLGLPVAIFSPTLSLLF